MRAVLSGTKLLFGRSTLTPYGARHCECPRRSRHDHPVPERERGQPRQRSRRTWRTPVVIIGFGCLITAIAFGPRATLGFFLTPLSTANHWGRDVFAFALAVQNLLWGVGQPFAGMIADRFGPVRVLCAGALMYALGLVLMAHATSAPMLDLSAGVLIGFGLAGASFMVVLAAFGKILPPQWRSIAFGLGTAAGSFGQFLFSPLAVLLMSAFGWQQALVTFAVVVLAVLPLSLALAMPRAEATTARRAAIAAAGTRRSLRASLLRAADCRFFYLRIPDRLRHRAPAVLPRRSRTFRRGRRLDHWRSSGCSISSAR